MKRTALTCALCLFLSACTTFEPPTKSSLNIQIPTNWRDTSGVIDSVNNPTLTSLIDLAIANNHQLKMAYYQVKIKQQDVEVAQSTLWPELSTSISSRRNRTSSETITNETSLSLDLKYELDLWGKLSDAEQRSTLDYLSSKQNYEQTKLQLIADVIKAWLDVIEAQKLEHLFQKRLTAAENNLDIVERSHQLGTGNALDVYLAKNDLSSEKTRFIEQQAAVILAKRELERLIGKYPRGTISISQSLPYWDQQINTVIPSELLSQKPALQASWLSLLSVNANLAYVHKQRFPSINLSGSYSGSAPNAKDVLNSSNLLWSIAGSITAPIFNAGRLKANEEVAQIELKSAEQKYINDVYEAFKLAENILTRDEKLASVLSAALAAEDNAVKAESLSFAQYRKGLVDYSTVLVSQQRSLQAQSDAINLKKRLAANRADLITAFGGEQLSRILKKAYE